MNMLALDESALCPLGIGGTIDVAFYGEYLVAIQSGSYPALNTEHNGRLLILSERADGSFEVNGALDGIGSARQIAIHSDCAYVTSREDGLFVIDISNPRAPRVLCRYETVEYATGICVAGNIAVVSLRSYGLELIDVTRPAAPEFISVARTGEAQSVWIDGAYVYAGVWGARELVITDISNPAEPCIVSRAPLDGRGDGVCVRGGVCYAATGHHARPKPDGRAYEGLGNGLELFDVSDPRKPVKLSCVKFPPYYGLTFDMWSVKLCGDMALVSNTRNGFFAVDISDASAPRVLKRILLPALGDGSRDPVGGFACSGGRLALAGAMTDAYIVRLRKPLAPPIPPRATVCAPGVCQALSVSFTHGEALRYERAPLDYNVRYAVSYGDRLYLACAEDGILVVDKHTYRARGRARCLGICDSICVLPPYLYAAEGAGGLAVYLMEGDGLKLIFRADLYGRAAFDLQLSGDNNFIAVQLASLGVVMFDIRDRARPARAGECLSFIGLLYGRHFPSRGYGDKCYLASNIDGLCFVRARGGELTRVSVPSYEGNFGFSSESGLEILADRLLLVSPKGFSLIPLDSGSRAPARLMRVKGADVLGKPRADGGLLVVTERATGVISFLNASDPDNIICVCQAKTSASPDLACFDGERVYIPSGRFGLLAFERPRLTAPRKYPPNY